RGLLQLGDIGMSSAAGAYQSLVGFVLILGANMLVRKISPDDALF
ncbi:MAG TPA: sugar ABC transporter permease, partial [Sellimonas intestinalis]|nr:sugar ABC transporter permease [Sellimonas intestinalis]